MRETNKYVLFWGNRDIYSNFYYSPFVHNGIKFKWSEQAVMYEKAMLFGAKDVANEILEQTSPMNCKSLGRSRRIPFDEFIWKENRERIYKEVLISKFSIPELKKKLLETKDKILVEASPTDLIWGIGYKENHPNATKPEEWRGLNLLGKVLMEVREELKRGG